MFNDQLKLHGAVQLSGCDAWHSAAKSVAAVYGAVQLSGCSTWQSYVAAAHCAAKWLQHLTQLSGCGVGAAKWLQRMVQLSGCSVWCH